MADSALSYDPAARYEVKVEDVEYRRGGELSGQGGSKRQAERARAAPVDRVHGSTQWRGRAMANSLGGCWLRR
jgi:hypothetical protein